MLTIIQTEKETIKLTTFIRIASSLKIARTPFNFYPHHSSNLFFFFIYNSFYHQSAVARAIDFPLNHLAGRSTVHKLLASASLDNDEGEFNEIIVYNKMRILTILCAAVISLCVCVCVSSLGVCDNLNNNRLPRDK